MGLRVAYSLRRLAVTLTVIGSLGLVCPVAAQAPDESRRGQQASMTKPRRIVGGRFTPHPVGADPAAGVRPLQPTPPGRVVYSNPLGDVAIVPGAGRLIADDISTTAANGCRLLRYSFKVVGKVDPQGLGGPFTVDFALYDRCPLSVAPDQRSSLTLPGTSGTARFNDDGAYEIGFFVPQGTSATIPNSFWLGVTFSRDNAGVIGGAPPLEGISRDHLAFRWCADRLGWFPNDPHSSFVAEVRTAGNCPPMHFGYRAFHESPGIAVPPGENVWLTDDIELEEPGCRMTGIEFAVKGAGTYEFALWEACGGPAIAQASFSIVVESEHGDDWSLVHKSFDPPVQVPQSLWFAARGTGPGASFPVTYAGPQLGDSDPVIGEWQDGLCTFLSLSPYSPEVLQVSILCAGGPTKGSCCDIYVKQCAGGSSNGQPCQEDSECGDGLCEIQCREIAEINCPIQHDSLSLRPQWVEHASCDQEPFPAAHPCGEFLCCHGTAGEPQCSNLTERDCLAMEPVGDFSGKWARGLHCSESQYVCPPLACVGATGSCTQPHSTPGCDHWECCVNICRQDYFCCLIEWDSLCLEGTVEGTCEPPPENDRCVGATLLPVPSIATTYSLFADALDETEQACCHNGQPPACYEGRRAGWMCDDHDDCWPGVCQERPLHVSPGLWYKFVATATSAKVHTCQSGAFGTTDSVLVVFAAAESSSAQAACASLTPIGCADDTPGCGPAGKLSEVCVTGLTPGRIYYILVGGKGYEGGEYRLSLSAPCSPTGPPDQPCLDARPK